MNKFRSLLNKADFFEKLAQNNNSGDYLIEDYTKNTVVGFISTAHPIVLSDTWQKRMNRRQKAMVATLTPAEQKKVEKYLDSLTPWDLIKINNMSEDEQVALFKQNVFQYLGRDAYNRVSAADAPPDYHGAPLPNNGAPPSYRGTPLPNNGAPTGAPPGAPPGYNAPPSAPPGAPPGAPPSYNAPPGATIPNPPSQTNTWNPILNTWIPILNNWISPSVPSAPVTPPGAYPGIRGTPPPGYKRTHAQTANKELLIPDEFNLDSDKERLRKSRTLPILNSN